MGIIKIGGNGTITTNWIRKGIRIIEIIISQRKSHLSNWGTKKLGRNKKIKICWWFETTSITTASFSIINSPSTIDSKESSNQLIAIVS